MSMPLANTTLKQEKSSMLVDTENRIWIKRVKRVFGWIGTILLLLIIPVKVVRWVDLGVNRIIIDIAPSFFGPAGLLFLILSSTKRLSRLTLIQAMMITGVIALGLEFAQHIPRPGILAKVRYTFDWLDIITTIISLVVAYLVAQFIIYMNQRVISTK